MMTWAPCPHGVRTRGKKNDTCLQEATVGQTPVWLTEVEVLEGRASLKHTGPQLCLGGEYIVSALRHSYSS